MVCDRLREHFKTLMDVGFTAHMEELLDKVAEGQQDWVALLRNFNNDFDPTLLEAAKSMGKAKTDTVTDIPCPECGKPLAVKFGKTGQFLACTGYPACRYTSNYTRDEQGRSIFRKRSSRNSKRSGPAPNAARISCSSVPAPAAGSLPARDIRTASTPNPIPPASPAPAKAATAVLVEKSSKRGKIFYSCSNYPQCDYACGTGPSPSPAPNAALRCW